MENDMYDIDPYPNASDAPCTPPKNPPIDWANSKGISPPSTTAKSYMHSEGLVDSDSKANFDPFIATPSAGLPPKNAPERRPADRPAEKEGGDWSP